MKKAISLTLAAAMSVGLLAGCGGSSSSASTAADSTAPAETTATQEGGEEYEGIPLSSDPVTLKVWESTAGADEFIKQAGAAFNEKYPNINIEYINVELGDAQGQIALDGPTGNGPDLFAAPNNTAAVLVSSGLILPTAQQDYVKTMLTDGSLTAMTYENELYGVPIASEGYAVFYNRALISDDEVPKTYEDLVAFCEKFNAENPGKYGFLMNVAQGYLSKIKQTEAELNALKSQIYPHFLYNTLEVIRMTAVGRNDQMVADMIEALSDQIRYVIGTVNDLVPLGREVDILTKYIYLLNCRFSDKVTFSYNCAHLENQLIPKLILQPIVENAFIHGIKPMDGPGHIQLMAEQNENRITLTVMDNGVGMDEAALNKLYTLLDSDQPGHKENYEWASIGLKNVHDRLRYLYGSDYGISLYSTPGVGTVVKATIPADLQNLEEEDSHAENADRG